MQPTEHRSNQEDAPSAIPRQILAQENSALKNYVANLQSSQICSSSSGSLIANQENTKATGFELSTSTFGSPGHLIRPFSQQLSSNSIYSFSGNLLDDQTTTITGIQ